MRLLALQAVYNFNDNLYHYGGYFRKVMDHYSDEYGKMELALYEIRDLTETYSGRDNTISWEPTREPRTSE